MYTWVDEKKKYLDIKNSPSLQNEMNYLEHRLIFAFFECGLCYNLNDSFPQLSQVQPLLQHPEIPNPSIQNSERSPMLVGPRQAKPFKCHNFFFFQPK